MEIDINLINKNFILDYQYQKPIFIFLIILIIGLNFYSLYFIKRPIEESYKELNNIDKFILSEQELFEIDWLNRNLVNFNINNWYNIIEDLIGDIGYINSIHFIDNAWEIRGDLLGIENYQILYERINELRSLNFDIKFNRVGSLQNSSFLLHMKIGDDS